MLKPANLLIIKYHMSILISKFSLWHTTGGFLTFELFEFGLENKKKTNRP